MENIFEIPFHPYFDAMDQYDVLPLSEYDIEKEGQLYAFIVTKMTTKVENGGRIILKFKINNSKEIIKVSCQSVPKGLWTNHVYVGRFDCSKKYGLELLSEDIGYFEEENPGEHIKNNKNRN
jgi:hypothetical protein